MERVRRPKKILGGFDKWSNWMLIVLLVVGGILVLVDATLIAGFFLESQGLSFFGWSSTPTPVVEATIRIVPEEGVPGTTIAVNGEGWRANEPLVVELRDPTGVCSAQVVATPNAGKDGHFQSAFALPTDECWASLSRAVVTAHYPDAEGAATAEVEVLALPLTPTPTATATSTPVADPTATASSTAITEPTATVVVEPTFTATPTPTPMPTSTATPGWPTATPTPAIVDWRGEYFDNTGLIGIAKVVRNDKGPGNTLGIDFDWGTDAPAVGLPADGFSARWTRALSFEEGVYRFQVVVDDGIRLYVDGDLVMDQWRDGGRRELTADRRMTAGRHTLRIEYYERSGAAVLQVRWERVVLPQYPDWKGEYWPNLSLQGNPVIVRNDKNPNGTLGIDFDWKQGSPGSTIPAEGFSARWTRKVALDAGTYRFRVLVDDGVRMWLNDRLIVDAWADHNVQEFVTDWALVKGTYTLKVEYYERIGNARIRVGWDRLTSPSYADWKGEYWPNQTLSGDMTLLRNDRAPNGTLGIDFDWGSGGPSPSLPADGFSARWTRQAQFDAARYRFHVLADDGIRLWVDGQLLIDKWQDQHPTEFTADRTMVYGTHSVKVEYYEHTGGARVHVWWDKVAVSYPDWRGEYWPNRDLSGSPWLVRNDKGPNGTPGIDLNWGTGAPATGLLADNFSVRWTRQVAFQAGTYRFFAWADDGVRASLGGRWIINEWHDARDQIYTTELSLDGTAQQVLVEYYERGGNAGVRFWWQRTGDLPTPVPAPKVQFSSAAYTADEGSGTATITVLLGAASDRTVTVDFATAGGSAAPGSDYGVASGTLAFNPGVTSRTFAVSIVDDGADEANETVALVLSNPVNAQLGATYQASLTIVDNDSPPPPPEARFGAATYSVDEGAGTATITVVLSAASEHTVSVNYGASDDTASAGSDYAASSGTLDFAPGVTSRTFVVNIIDDGIDEADETVVLALSSPSNAVLGAPSQAVLTIVDNDVTPPASSSVRLNEVLPVPGGTDWDKDGTASELDEWVELVNSGTTAMDLSGWLLDDVEGESVPYLIPAATVLEPGAFLVLYRKDTGVVLDDGGDAVRLLDPSGQVVDAVTFGAISADTSYNRSESGTWYEGALASPGAPNPSPTP